MKNTLLAVSYTTCAASLRCQALKGIKGLVKLNSENLLDEQVKKALQLRIRDPSAITRESALDLLSKYITNQRKSGSLTDEKQK